MKKPIDSTNRFVNTISQEIPAENAEKAGKDFWEIFKKKAKDNICGNRGIIRLLEDKKINEALEKIVPKGTDCNGSIRVRSSCNNCYSYWGTYASFKSRNRKSV